MTDTQTEPAKTTDLSAVPDVVSPSDARLHDAIEAWRKSSGRELTQNELQGLAQKLSDREMDAIVIGADARPDWRLADRNDPDPATFGLHIPKDVPAIWGGGERAYWTEGELGIIYGGDGTNKTTLAHNVMAGLLGFDGFDTVLGQPVHRLGADEKVLYLAFDRPRQIERSWSRFMRPQYAEHTAQHMTWRSEALPFDASLNPLWLAEWIREVYPGTAYVVLDNVWDAFGDFSKTEHATAAGIALNNVARSGIHTLALHHNTKGEDKGRNAAPESHIGMYGGRNFAAKAGTIVNLWKPAKNDGSTLTVTQHKEPSERIPRSTYLVDQKRGTFLSLSSPDLTLAQFMEMDGGKLTLTKLVKVFAHTEKPNNAQREKARRYVDRLIEDGQVREYKQEGNRATLFQWLA